VNIPNTLTLARIVLVPLVVWLIITHQTTAAFVLFLLAGVSDAADGYLAKRFQWRTELGAYLDPIADKLLLMSIYVTLGFSNTLPAWRSSRWSAATSSSSAPSCSHGCCRGPFLSIRCW
jgi:cardiolipin synthase